jgi:hypothetical protein
MPATKRNAFRILLSVYFPCMAKDTVASRLRAFLSGGIITPFAIGVATGI